ncbi:hypothetical protein MFIFM68171_02862 [Madurella fahalii]|uniref:Protein kinase domain-containing protein n=1 Tax=Madurella fahalii TaxID=1157608 RepID=A0ABQ0G4G3_9PEZI
MEEGYYTDGAETPLEPHTPAFLLAPVNPAARKAVDLPENDGLRGRFHNTIGLWIDFSNPDKQIFTLGCGDTDIYLPNTGASGKGSPHISEVHASFQLVEETGAVLLYDHSEDGTVETITHNHGYTIKLRSNSRSVLVARGINPRFGLGQDKWYQFKIQWQSDGLYAFPNKDEPYTMGPSNSRTKKYLQGDRVGGGSYGTVWWVLDVTNGRVMAVKKFHNLSGKNLDFATREVANLFRINQDSSIKHEHILQIFDYAGGGERDNWGEIFMPLMKGNLKTLVEDPDGPDPVSLADVVLRQMLLALQCIASHNIVHRDVKPENVLWEPDGAANYRFCLGDFGLSNDPGLARTAAGTEPFMAPEVFNRQKQTTKVDIWSLFATIVWMRSEEFRKTCSHMRAPDLHRWLVSISKLDWYATIRKMASMDPKKRPSATKQLAILDGDFEDYSSLGGYGSGSGEGPVADLSGRFSSMRLQETPNLSYGSSNSDQVTSPELPYYEPYASGLIQNYLEEINPGGQSKRYVPPTADPDDTPRGHEGAWVMPYESPYGPAETQDSGSGTAVPENWTATARPFLPNQTLESTNQLRASEKRKVEPVQADTPSGVLDDHPAVTDQAISDIYSFDLLPEDVPIDVLPEDVQIDLLPEDLQIDLKLSDENGVENCCWTCTPSDTILDSKIPLIIDGLPVVLPVRYQYPLVPLLSPPPDPHPQIISPTKQISQETVGEIFALFSQAIGFYILINGDLQVIVPDDFDYEHGLASLPREFGGLKVSFIPLSLYPTAGEGVSSTSTTMSATDQGGSNSSQGPSSGMASTQAPLSFGTTPSTPLLTYSFKSLFGSTVRAVVQDSRAGDRFDGKIGVVVSPLKDSGGKNCPRFATVSTHVFTGAVAAVKKLSPSSTLWRPRTAASEPASNWIQAVTAAMVSRSLDLGPLAKVFDLDPQIFPIGFTHDVSLIDISHIPIPPTSGWQDAQSPDPAVITPLEWFEQHEWTGLKYNSTDLRILDGYSVREAKSIGVVDSRCQLVGQGIFRVQQQSRRRSLLSGFSSSARTADARNEASTWTSLVARSILYRVRHDAATRGGQSGTPVCVLGSARDGTPVAKVAGFASFAQMVSDVQRYDLEGDKLYKRLEEGRVAFYGAFQLPKELTEDYIIV